MNSKTRKQRFREIQSASIKELNACVIELAEPYLSEFPNSQGGWDLYSLALYKTDRFKNAKRALIKAIKLSNETANRYSWLLCRMGDIYESSGHFSKAIEWYNKAHNSNPNEATFLIFQGRMLLRTEKYDNAAEIFLKATECEAGCIDEAFYNLGVTRLIQKRYLEASVYFEKALEMDPKYKEAKQQLKDVTQVIAIVENKQNQLR
jgi:tetratricopeptide (TPR) repeat protein